MRKLPEKTFKENFQRKLPKEDFVRKLPKIFFLNQRKIEKSKEKFDPKIPRQNNVQFCMIYIPYFTVTCSVNFNTEVPAPKFQTQDKKQKL